MSQDAAVFATTWVFGGRQGGLLRGRTAVSFHPGAARAGPTCR